MLLVSPHIYILDTFCAELLFGFFGSLSTPNLPPQPKNNCGLPFTELFLWFSKYPSTQVPGCDGLVHLESQFVLSSINKGGGGEAISLGC